MYPQTIMNSEEEIRQRFELLSPHLDERTRRLTAAAEATVIGFGGATRVARATGISRLAIGRGIKELKAAPGLILLAAEFGGQAEDARGRSIST